MKQEDWFWFGIYFLVALALLLAHLVFQFNPYRFYQPGLKLIHYTYRSGAGFAGVIVNYFRDREELHAELGKYKDRVAELEREVEKLQYYRTDSRNLRKHLRFPPAPAGRPVAVEVTAHNLSSLERTVYLNKGYNTGIQADAPLLDIAGDTWVLRGKVHRVHAEHSLALLVDDPRFTVGVRLEGIPDRSFVLRGGGYGDLVMKNVPAVLEIEPGMRVYTAEASTVAPKNVLVGRVAEIEQEGDAGGVGHQLRIEKAASDQFFRTGWVLIQVD